MCVREKPEGWIERSYKRLLRIPREILWLYPELRRVDDDRVRGSILRSVPTGHERVAEVLSLLVFLTLVAISAFQRWWVVLFVAMPLAGVGPQLIANGFGRARTRRAIRMELARRGIPVCVQCGYDIRGLPENRCPECGEAFDPISQA